LSSINVKEGVDMRRLEWVAECKNNYIKELYARSKEYARDEEWEIRGLRALLALTKQRGLDKWILRTEVNEEALIESASAGQWAWTQAGIVEKHKEDGRCFYRISSEFYEVVEQIFGN